MYATKQAVRLPSVVVCFCANGLKTARLGVSVSSKNGNAVHRNRIKRVFRAAFRQCTHVLPAGNDYVFIPRKGTVYTTALMCLALAEAAKKIAKVTEQARRAQAEQNGAKASAPGKTAEK